MPRIVLMALYAVAAVMGAAAALFLYPREPGDTVVWSPDHKLYAQDSPGRQVGEGQERERLEVFSAQGKQTAVAHVWLVQPDGTQHAGIRGCESWGWIDSTRLFCEGTIDPDSGAYLVYDAKSGRELRELIGRGFAWSPDRSRIADVGDGRELGAVDERSDSIEVEGKPVFPSAQDTQPHRFRSGLVWSPDSRYIAVVDQRHREGSVYLVVVGVPGSRFERELQWQDKAEDWPPELNYGVVWAEGKIIVKHGEGTQTVVVTR